MNRLRISCDIDVKSGIRAIIKTKNTVKICAVYRDKWYINTDSELKDEFHYQLRKRCREAIRDELSQKYGKCWRKYEQPLQVELSIKSALKRMRSKSP
jgi:hypothetical protein